MTSPQNAFALDWLWWYSRLFLLFCTWYSAQSSALAIPSMSRMFTSKIALGGAQFNQNWFTEEPQ